MTRSPRRRSRAARSEVPDGIGGATAPPVPPVREVAISNQHRRLRIDPRALLRALATLDQAFRYTRADGPALAPAAKERARRQSAAAAKAGTSARSSVPSALPAGELSIVFLTDAALAELHGRFLDDPSTTDVITFEGVPEMGTAGEICVSVDTAARYACDRNTDFSRELLLYVVHGWLHLAGYDDLRPAKKRRMRAAEARALALLDGCFAAPLFRLVAATASRGY